MNAETLRRIVLLGLAWGWLALFLVLPCAIVSSIASSSAEPMAASTMSSRSRIIPRRRHLYLPIFWPRQRSQLATLAALAIGYPAAYLIATAPKQWQTTLLILVMLPFWSNYLIRTYAWIVLLNREGLINNGLQELGLIGEPLPLLYNQFAIVVGLLYGYLPFMVLALYSSISRLNPEIFEASSDLGASSPRTFLRVTLPLTIPGIAAGCVFVFVLSIGNFVTPDLLGGGRSLMVGNLIFDQFLSARDWPFGSSLAFVLIGLMMLLLVAQAWAVNLSQHEGADA
jgi:spermidine/putrescine transport system permease protein